MGLIPKVPVVSPYITENPPQYWIISLQSSDGIPPHYWKSFTVLDNISPKCWWYPSTYRTYGFQSGNIVIIWSICINGPRDNANSWPFVTDRCLEPIHAFHYNNINPNIPNELDFNHYNTWWWAWGFLLQQQPNWFFVGSMSPVAWIRLIFSWSWCIEACMKYKNFLLSDTKIKN